MESHTQNIWKHDAASLWAAELLGRSTHWGMPAVCSSDMWVPETLGQNPVPHLSTTYHLLQANLTQKPWFILKSISTIYTFLGNSKVSFTLLSPTQAWWQILWPCCCHSIIQKKQNLFDFSMNHYFGVNNLTTFEGSSFFLLARSVILIPL